MVILDGKTLDPVKNDGPHSKNTSGGGRTVEKSPAETLSLLEEQIRDGLGLFFILNFKTTSF